jgi:hypothetical protein
MYATDFLQAAWIMSSSDNLIYYLPLRHHAQLFKIGNLLIG